MANKKDIIKKKKGEVIKEAKVEKTDKDLRALLDSKKKAGILIVLTTVIVLLIVLGSLWISNYFGSNDNDLTSNNFKEEYESLNGKDTGYGKEYLSISIDSENVVQYADYNRVFEVLERGSGVIYFGFPECPWCRNLVPVLLDAADEAGIDTIYYLNAQSDRDVKNLDDDGNIVTEKEGTENYYKLVDKLSSFLTEYEGLGDETIKRLYFPTVVFVKDGRIIASHIGTIDSQEDPYVGLTDDEYTSLKDQLVTHMEEIITCDSAC